MEDVKKFCQNITSVKSNKNKNLLLKKSFNRIIHTEKKFASEIIVEDIIKMNPPKENLYKADLITFAKNWARNFLHDYNVTLFFLKSFF